MGYEATVPVPFLGAGVENPRWNGNETPVTTFKSDWGAPYGTRQLLLQPGKSIAIDGVCTDVSVAYVDRPKQKHYMENRKGILGLGYGLHTVRLQAVSKPVVVLGVFTYDLRRGRQESTGVIVPRKQP